jgi:hypothetical protein
VACLAVQYFSTLLSHVNGTTFGEKLLNTKRLFCFSVQLLSETFLILRRTERDMVKNEYWSSCKVPVILWDLIETLIFSTVPPPEKYVSSFTKFHLVGAALIHADGQTGITKLMVAFRSKKLLRNHLSNSSQLVS